MTKKLMAALAGVAAMAALTMSASAAEYNWVAAIHLPETTTHTQALQYFGQESSPWPDKRPERENRKSGRKEWQERIARGEQSERRENGKKS